MGTFLGHLLPGLALVLLGLWHAINTIQLYYLKDSNKFISRFWYPLKNPPWKLKHLELILLLSFSLLSILIQVFDLQRLRFFFELDNIEHATMFFHLIIFTLFTLFTESNNLSDQMLGVSGILVASLFGEELFLLHYHSSDHVGLEGHYHWLMQIIVSASFFTSLFVTCCPSSFPGSLLVAVSVAFQGCWFVNMGFVLWDSDFVPRGCVNDAAHGAVVCGSRDADSRARALANLQFCWIFTSILIFMASVCVVLGRRCASRRALVEYEQLSSPGVHDHLSTVGFKQIQL